jgi:hypothetical protein
MGKGLPGGRRQAGRIDYRIEPRSSLLPDRPRRAAAALRLVVRSMQRPFFCAVVVCVLAIISRAADAAAAANGDPHCIRITSVSFSVVWPAAAAASSSSSAAAAAAAAADGAAAGAATGSDLYYVTLSEAADAQPFALQTSSEPHLVLRDLHPNTTYYMRWRSHPAGTQRNIGWDWRPATKAFACTTRPTAVGAPHSITRGPLAEDQITLAWAAPSHGPSLAAAATEQAGYSVGYRTMAPETIEDHTHRWLEANASNLTATLSGLKPGCTYGIVVAATTSSHPSDSPDGGRSRAISDEVVFRTAAKGFSTGDVRYTAMTRVSEFTDDVDFLDNHDSATSAALAVLLARMAKQVNVSSDCLSQLSALGCARAQGETCLDCVRNLSAPASCGDANMADYNAHFFCGEGWPSFSM